MTAAHGAYPKKDLDYRRERIRLRLQNEPEMRALAADRPGARLRVAAAGESEGFDQGFADAGVLLWLRAHRGRSSAERMLMKVSNAAANAAADEVASTIVIENECADARASQLGLTMKPGGTRPYAV